jgi:hypothetical protein
MRLGQWNLGVLDLVMLVTIVGILALLFAF